MLTEQDLQSTPPAAAQESSSLLSPNDTQTLSPDERFYQAIETMRRDNTELKGHIFHLRTDVERASSNLKKTIIASGVFVVLAIVLGVAGFGTSFVSSFKEADEFKTASVKGFSSGLTELTGLNRQLVELAAGLRELTTRLNRQLVTSEHAENPTKPPPTPAKLDCANLPAARKASAIDFSIQFPVGSAKILPETEATLTSIAKLLALSPNGCVLVEGHTDATGNADKNMELSEHRANAVINYIAHRASIERDRLVPLPKGSSSPAVGLDPRHPQNRRVVVRLITE